MLWLAVPRLSYRQCLKLGDASLCCLCQLLSQRRRRIPLLNLLHAAVANEVSWRLQKFLPMALGAGLVSFFSAVESAVSGYLQALSTQSYVSSSGKAELAAVVDQTAACEKPVMYSSCHPSAC